MNKVFYNRWTGKNEPMGQSKTCSLDDCNRAYEAKGLCSMHYLRLKRHGSTDYRPTFLKDSNPELLRERRLERIRKWKEANRDKIRAYTEKNIVNMRLYRRASEAKRRSITKQGKVNLRELFNAWDGVCGICAKPVLGETNVDHITPLSRGGLHSQENLQITHPLCNRKKWAKTDYSEISYAKG